MPGRYAVEQQSGTGGGELEADRGSLGHMQAIAAWSLVDVGLPSQHVLCGVREGQEGILRMDTGDIRLLMETTIS